MKNKLWVIILLTVFSNMAFSQSITREKLLFDLGWKFHLGDLNKAKDPMFDDSLWRSVNLPHDWNIEGDFNKQYASCTGYLPAGIGWYRKKFDIPQDYSGKTVTIQFDGVYCNSEVWVNGKYVGKHAYGYTSFYYNITPYLEFGKKNVITVRVDHMKYADTRWYSGSGIYRHVWLFATDKIHVAQWGSQVFTSDVSPSFANVKVKTIISNDNKVNKPVKLLSALVGMYGKEVASGETNVQLSDSLTSVNQNLSIKNPILWDTENPYLYKVITKIISGTNVIDEYETPFGIRTIKFDANKGFFLNGENIKLKGVCMHHDGGCLGAAVPEKLWRIRLEKLKAVGCNAIRTSHNPPAPEFLDLCDQMGFLVMDEAFDEWEYNKCKWIEGWTIGKPGLDGYGDVFEQSSEKDLSGMVFRDINHPSIILWSIGNELDYNKDPYTDPTAKDYSTEKPDFTRMVDIAHKLTGIVKSIDTSRPVTMAIAVNAISNKLNLPAELDIAGYNYTEWAYEKDHKQYPERIIFGSENSHDYAAWVAVKNNNFISGQFLWTGVDYMGEAGPFPNHAADFGLLDLTSMEKPIYYWRQAMWTEKPVLYLIARKKKASDDPSKDPMLNIRGFLNSSGQDEHWNYKNGDSVVVMAFTNCKEVELFINGKSFGKKKSDPANSCVWWNVQYETGELNAIAKSVDGKKLTAKLNVVSEPVKLLLKTDSKKLKANNEDISIVEVQLLDKNGNRALFADNRVNFKISGEGKIIGVDNGDLSSIENYKSPKRKAFHGRCIVIIQSAGTGGSIKLTATSQGIPDTSIELISE